MIETEFQHGEIMPFFCKPEESDGRGTRVIHNTRRQHEARRGAQRFMSLWIWS